MRTPPDYYALIQSFVESRLRAASKRPLVVGINAPQGAGKSTLVEWLLPRLWESGIAAVGLSIDDFYLTHAQQRALAAAHPGNPYLEHRGYPGTHDIALGEATLSSLVALGAGEELRLPGYDKSAHGGRGDRRPESEWRPVAGPIDVVLLEGWMLAFAPVAESTLSDPGLAEPNRLLAEYGRWDHRLDCMVILRATDTRHVRRWRVEAEEAARAAGRPALSRAEIEDYIRRFLPAYDTWSGTLAGEVVAQRWPVEERLEMCIDERRVRMG